VEVKRKRKANRRSKHVGIFHAHYRRPCEIRIREGKRYGVGGSEEGVR